MNWETGLIVAVAYGLLLGLLVISADLIRDGMVKEDAKDGRMKAFSGFAAAAFAAFMITALESLRRAIP